MKKVIPILILLAAIFCTVWATHEKKPENVVLITLDGYRWQELFGGIDTTLVNSEYTKDSAFLMNTFWADDQQERARKLNPFLYEFLMEEGLLLGNRWENSKVNCTNTHWFSYPGYNEILSGQPNDSLINSNAKTPNPHITFLEKLNESKEFSGKVAAFASWDVFPFIINEDRSGVPVNAGFEEMDFGNHSSTHQLIDDIQMSLPRHWETVRYDAITHYHAMEYMKQNQPRVMYISYGETDDFAHEGDYDAYIKSAYQTNQFIKEIWEYIETDEKYKGKTTLLITTDHGRGTVPVSTWKGHGSSIEGAGAIWLGAMGVGIDRSLNPEQQFYQQQVSPTIMDLLGKEWAFGTSIFP